MAKAERKGVKFHLPTDFITSDKFDKDANVGSKQLFWRLQGPNYMYFFYSATKQHVDKWILSFPVVHVRQWHGSGGTPSY